MQQSLQLMEIAKNMKIVFELNVQPGDSALVLTDSAQETDVWMAIATAGRLYGCEVTVSIMADPRTSNLAPPPKSVTAAMREADLTISATTKEFHTGGHYKHATDYGHKFIIMEGVTSDILMGPSVKADYRLMNEVGPKLKAIMDQGRKWHITTDTGTDFSCEVIPNTGKFMAARADAANNPRHVAWADFPGGEFGASPVSGSGNGVFVWDTSVHHPPGLLREPIVLTIKDGKVVKIEGGVEAGQLIGYIKQHSIGINDEFDIELSIGFNPCCPISGVLRTDKKHYGKIHTAIGQYLKGQLHIDGVTLKPTIDIDGKLFMEDGVIKVPPLDTWTVL
jgi:leucyl aminopeptidase (aminopeptidase T)